MVDTNLMGHLSAIKDYFLLAKVWKGAGGENKNAEKGTWVCVGGGAKNGERAAKKGLGLLL